MRTILLMVFLGVTLGVSAYVWNEKYQNQPGKVGAIGTSSTQAANVSKVTESTAGVPDVRGAKERCFDASKEAILKELRAPRSAVFADSTAGVKFERGEADSYKMESYVDAQNEFGAHIRMKWETLFDKDEKLVWKGRMTSTDPKSLRTLLDDLVKVGAEELRKQKLL